MQTYNKHTPVFVAGAGMISAIGNNVTECLNALEEGQAGMGDISYLDTVHRKQIPVAEVKQSNRELALLAGLPERISRTALLCMIAAREALDSAAIEDLSGLRTALVSANTVGGMDKSEAFFIDFLADHAKGKLKDVFYHECAASTRLVADQLGIRNHVTTISTACSSSANAIMYGARLIKHGMLDVVIAGGADALTKFTLNGFNTLMILDKEYCKPFDEYRNGLNLGEGAGYVVLVSEKVAASLKSGIICRLSGYCNKNDAYHQTASSPDGKGSYLAMSGALENSGLTPFDIDYINLHGTGTQNNDLAEGTAIKRLFEPHYPPMSSTKSLTGHTLGASGGIEAVFSSLSVKYGLIYPNLRFNTRMRELPFVPESVFSKNKSVEHVLSNSFGFGGNCSSLIFSKIAG
jgi:3-oxoacyl-(acyl-carrier-protein) synthase